MLVTCPYCNTEHHLKELESQDVDCECGAFYAIRIVQNWMPPKEKK